MLEREAGALGYTRACLTTGFRQPEAVAFYLSINYRPLFDVSADPESYRSLPFEKHIGKEAAQPGRSPVRRAAGSLAEATAAVHALKAEQGKKILARLAHLADWRVPA